MRVVSGVAKGRRLTAPASSTVRPATDRLKEALFNILFDVEGEEVLDLFAGCGSLAVEALSRGARHATLVDADREAVEHQRRNLEVTGFSEQATVVRTDVLAFLERSVATGTGSGHGRGDDGPAGPNRPPTWDLVFVDPPYDLDLGYLRRLADLLGASGRLGPATRIAFERRTGDGPPPLPDGFEIRLDRAYGQTTLYVAEHAAV